MPKKQKSSAKPAAAEVKPTSAASKQSAQVPLLYYNKVKGTSNLTIWEEKLKLFLGQEYGRGADFLETGSKYVPPVVPNPANDAFSQQNDPHGLKLKLYEKQLTRREELIASMEEDYPKAFSHIVSFFSAESLERVKQDPDYTAAEADKDPVLLMPIWRRTHTQAQSGNVVVDEDTATALYFGCVQSDICTLANHKNYINQNINI